MPATPAQIRKRLKEVAPDLQFEVTWTVDRYYEWDFDGPDPREQGFLPYDVDVYARARNGPGQLLEGHSSLGGSYAKPGKFDPDVNGYLPQMLRDAVDELAMLVAGTDLGAQVHEAHKLLTRALRIRYDEQVDPARKQDWSPRRKKGLQL